MAPLLPSVWTLYKNNNSNISKKMTDLLFQSLLMRVVKKFKHQKHWYCPWRHDMFTSLTGTFTHWKTFQWSLRSLLFFFLIPFLRLQSLFDARVTKNIPKLNADILKVDPLNENKILHGQARSKLQLCTFHCIISVFCLSQYLLLLEIWMF